MDTLYTFLDSRGTMASGDLRAVETETEVGVGQNMMVRDGAAGERCLYLRSLSGSGQGSEEAAASFNGLGVR